MNYQELIRFSTKGDKQALEELFALAEKLSAEKNHEEASKVFREAAISYRISAFRNSGLTGEANGKVYWLNKEIELIKHWLEANPTGLRSLPRIVEGMTKKFILEVLRDEVWPDSQFEGLIPLIESALQNNGAEFSSPGGSSLRQIISLMIAYFGLNAYGSATLDLLEVRIGMDQLADEVERRFHASKKD